MSATKTERTVKGLLGTKLGMTQLWDANNRVVPVTVVQAGPCVVTQVRTPDVDGYSAVQLGFGAVKAKQLTKPSAGHFEKAGVTPRKHLVEIRTSDASEYSLGQELSADVFAAGDVIDATGVSKGKGTAGVMKRHGFGGLRASHGVHRKHRAPVRSAVALRRAGFSKGSAWPGVWVPSASPCKTCWSMASTPIVA